MIKIIGNTAYYNDIDIENLHSSKVIISFNFNPEMSVLKLLFEDLNEQLDKVYTQDINYDPRNDYDFVRDEYIEQSDLFINDMEFYYFKNHYYTYITMTDREVYLNRKGDVEIIEELCKKYQTFPDETYIIYKQIIREKKLRNILKN